MEEKEPVTRDEVMAHNFEMMKKMRDAGMSAAVIHAVFQKNGINVTLEFVQECCKPGVIENLSARGYPKSIG